MKLVFMGTAGFAVPSLERLASAGFEIVAVYTQPPRAAGRGKRPRKTEVHEAAERLGLEVCAPASLKDEEERAAFAAYGADLAVVAAYGLLLPQPILDAPRLGCVNIHASLLPRWRGAAPIQRALLAGDRESGICVFRMEAGLDTGPVYARHRLAIPEGASASWLHDRLAALAAERIGSDLAAIAAGATPIPQPEEGITYAHKLHKSEGRIGFDAPAREIERRLRALNPAPGCWGELAGERIRLLEGNVVPGEGPPGTIVGAPLVVACAEDAIALRRVQRAGRKPMSSEEMLRGLELPAHARFASP